jgi:hypothetical protein
MIFLKAIVMIIQAILIVLGVAYTYFLVSALLTCSPIPSIIGTHCSGEKVNVWVPVIFGAPVGIPALLLTIAMLVVGLRRLLRR